MASTVLGGAPRADIVAAAGDPETVLAAVSHPLVAKFPPRSESVLAALEVATDTDADERLVELLFDWKSRPRQEYIFSSFRVAGQVVSLRSRQDWRVGTTLWTAGFTLAEYMHLKPDLFSGFVLELGAGVGTTASILHALNVPVDLAVSDFTDDVLANLAYNLKVNDVAARVVELDWLDARDSPALLAAQTVVAADCSRKPSSASLHFSCRCLR